MEGEGSDGGIFAAKKTSIWDYRYRIGILVVLALLAGEVSVEKFGKDVHRSGSLIPGLTM